MADKTSVKLRNQVIYQIFTRNYKEGTFRAIEGDLERIKALGTDYIYLLPVQPSGEVNRKGSMGSPYAIKDYRAIDPVQGTKEEFIHLCEAVHEAGMKIMIDVVYNHTSPDSWLAENYPEWFYHKEDGSLGNRVGEWWDVVDLDYANEDLWDYQIDTLCKWARYVDGFRCDVAPMIPLAFWLRARAEVEKVNKECVWLAESVEPGFIAYNREHGIPTSSDGELFQAFDICYDYDVYHLMKGVMLGTVPAKDYVARVNLQEAIFPDNYSKLRCLENHDRPRAAALIQEESVLRSWLAWSYFQKGTVMLYAGEEFCVTKHPTLFDRDTVNFDTGKDLSAYLAKLKGIKNHRIFREGIFHAEVTGVNGDVIIATMTGKADTPSAGNRAVGIFPLSHLTHAVELKLPNGIYTNAIDGTTFELFEETLVLTDGPVILLDVKGE